MSVITLNTSVTYTSAGSVGPYPFDFPISTAAALKVIQNNVVLASTAYTVTPVNNNFDNGGSVTLITAPTAGQTIVLQRSTPLTQASVFHDNLPQPMQEFENSLDKLTEIVQELAANQGSGVSATSVTAGVGIVVTGTGTLSDPYIISTATAFAIISFNGGQMLELGFSLVNPSFTATYTGTPTSANITNTDSVSSPTNLTTPFTSGTISGTFSHSVAHTTTFTLNASNGVSSGNLNATVSWSERIFGGVGATGATGIVTSSGTTAVLSTGDALPSTQLGPEIVDQVFGPYSPIGQSVYLLLTGSSHTFKDDISGFPFAFKTAQLVEFANVNGIVLTMYLYESTNPLNGTFSPKVVS